MRLTFPAVTLTLLLPFPTIAQDITFAWTPNPSTPQVDIALAQGMFDDAGLNVELVSFPSGREGFEALIGGQVDIAFMAEFPAATGLLTGQQFGIIGDLSRYKGMRIIGKGEALESGPYLAGKQIGTTIGTNTDFYLSKVLSAGGVDVVIVNAAPSDLVPALSRGDVEAIVPFPTFYAAAATALGDDYQELRVPGYETHYILATNAKMLNAENAAALQSFLSVLYEADAIVTADPDAALAATAASLQGVITPETLALLWKDTEFALNLSPRLPELLLEEASWLLGKGVIRAEPPTLESVSAYIVTEPLRAVAADRVTIE